MRAAVLLFGAPREQRKKPISEFSIGIQYRNLFRNSASERLLHAQTPRYFPKNLYSSTDKRTLFIPRSEPHESQRLFLG